MSSTKQNQQLCRESHSQLSTEASSSNGLVSSAKVTSHGDALRSSDGGSASQGRNPGQQPGKRSKSERSSVPRGDSAKEHRPRAAGTRATRKASKVQQSTSNSIAEMQAAEDASQEKIKEMIDNQEHLIAEVTSVCQSLLFPSQQLPQLFGAGDPQALSARAPVCPPPGPVPICPHLTVHAPPETVRVSLRRLASFTKRGNKRLLKLPITETLTHQRLPSAVLRPGFVFKALGVPVVYLNPFFRVPKECGSRKYALRVWPDPLPRRYRVNAKPVAGPSVPTTFSHVPRVFKSLEEPLMSVPENPPSWLYDQCNRWFVTSRVGRDYTILPTVMIWTLIVTLGVLFGLAFWSNSRNDWNTKALWPYCMAIADRDIGHSAARAQNYNEFLGSCFALNFRQLPGVLSYGVVGVTVCALFGAILWMFVGSILDDYEAKKGLGMVLTSKRCVHVDDGADRRHMVHQNVDIKRKGDLWEVTLDFFSYNTHDPVRTPRTIVVSSFLLEELLSSKFDKWGDKAELVDERFKDVHKILGAFNIPADRYESDVVRDTLFVARNVLSIRRARAKFLQQDMPKGF